MLWMFLWLLNQISLLVAPQNHYASLKHSDLGILQISSIRYCMCTGIIFQADMLRTDGRQTGAWFKIAMFSILYKVFFQIHTYPHVQEWNSPYNWHFTWWYLSHYGCRWNTKGRGSNVPQNVQRIPSTYKELGSKALLSINLKAIWWYRKHEVLF